MLLAAERIRKGLYRLVGVRCECGGEVRAEDTRPYRGEEKEFFWECFCEACKKCDPNGWPTLTACILEAPKYWKAETGKVAKIAVIRRQAENG